MSYRLTRLVSLLLLLAALPLQAQEPAPSGHPFYLGLGAGTQQVRPEDGTASQSRGTITLIGGYEYGRYVGAELGFHFLGSRPANLATDSSGTDWSRDVTGLSLAGIGRWQVVGPFTLLGRVGLLYWNSGARSQTNGMATVTDSRDTSRRGASSLLGFGLETTLSHSWVVRLDLDTTPKVLDARISLWRGSLLYRF